MSHESSWYEKRAEEMRALSETALTSETKEQFLLLSKNWAAMAATVDHMEQQREWLKTLPP